MYINYFGNVFCDCVILGKPKYQEEAGEYRQEMTKATAKCKEQTPDGVQQVNLNLLFFGAFAIPAMKITSGLCIVVAGREKTNNLKQKGHYILERTIFVDWWTPREADPVGMLSELKARREITVREKEFKEIFWEWLNLPTCRELVMGWLQDWLKENAVAVKLKKKEDEPKA